MARHQSSSSWTLAFVAALLLCDCNLAALSATTAATPNGPNPYSLTATATVTASEATSLLAFSPLSASDMADSSMTTPAPHIFPRGKKGRKTKIKTSSTVSTSSLSPFALLRSPPTVWTPAPDVFCFNEEESGQVNFDSCRKALREIRDRPDRHRQQNFQHDKYPRSLRPPVTFGKFDPECRIRLRANEDALALDVFSWEEVRLAAQEILQHCQEQGGRGGYTEVGRDQAFRVFIGSGNRGFWELDVDNGLI